MKRIALVIALALCTAMVNGTEVDSIQMLRQEIDSLKNLVKAKDSLQVLIDERDSLEVAIAKSIRNGHIVSVGHYSMLVEKLIDNYTKAFELAYYGNMKSELDKCVMRLKSLLFPLPVAKEEVILFNIKDCRGYYPISVHYNLDGSRYSFAKVKVDSSTMQVGHQFIKVKRH